MQLYTGIAYGTGLLAWLANMAMGNNGGMVHLVFAATVQFMKFAPFVSLYFLFDLNSYYLPSDAAWNTATADLDNPSDLKYLFNPGETLAEDPHYLNPAWINRRWAFFFNTMFTAFLFHTVGPTLVEEYQMKSAMNAEETSPEEMESTEPVEEEEAVPEEESWM